MKGVSDPESRGAEPPDVPQRYPDVQSSLSAGPVGTIRWSVQSRPPQGEAGAGYPALAVVAYLRLQGHHWSDPKPPQGREEGVDWISEGAVDLLRMQVTRVPSGEEYYRELGTLGFAGGESTAEQLADHLMEAIRHKAPPGQESLNRGRTLVLDAQNSLAHGLPFVLDNFDTRHHREAVATGFDEIWLVCGWDQVHRLAPGEWVAG